MLKLGFEAYLWTYFFCMIKFPNAKINIGLNIMSRRTDGYHNIETVFYPVNINDALEVVEAPQLEFSASGIEIPGYANENLCLRAYELLRRDFDIPPVHIHLHKNIPIGAGLGGGSSDAAFFITIMNEKFGLGMDGSKLENYARLLGADCAFFLHNRALFAQGKGDILEDIHVDLSAYTLVLVMPPVHVSTGEAYRGVRPSHPEAPLKELALTDPGLWKGKIINDFEAGVFSNHPSIRGVKSELYERGAVYASMSGSGASVYGLFKSCPDLSHLEEHNKVFYNI